MANTEMARAIGRSLRIYYAPGRAERMDPFHRRFLGAGDLAFDIGAHVGDRTASFRRLGARVIAVEPQPALARLLRRLFHGDADVKVVPAMAGSRPGMATLRLNRANQTIATASDAFIAAARNAAGWTGERWDGEISVETTTLDLLAGRHGWPDFMKIDVEGFEAELLAGLSRPTRALSFEFTTIQRSVALDCLRRLRELGYAAFNACLGESMAFEHPRPLPGDALAEWMLSLPQSANSGDVYASTEAERISR